MVSVAVVHRMEANGYHGKGTGSYSLKLCRLGPLLPRKILEFKCDNQGLVDAINKGSSKEPVVMHLLRCLWFFSAFFSKSPLEPPISSVLLTRQRISSLETKQLNFYTLILRPPTSRHKFQSHCYGSCHPHALIGPPEPSRATLGVSSTQPSSTLPVLISKDSNYPPLY